MNARHCAAPTIRRGGSVPLPAERPTDELYRGRVGAKLTLETCAPGRFRHVWVDEEPHPVNGFWRFACLHCEARAAVAVRGAEVGQ